MQRGVLAVRVFGSTFSELMEHASGFSFAAAAPLCDPAHIVALFSERLSVLNDGLEADFGFDLLRLTAEDVQKTQARTADFIDNVDDGDLIALIDRFSVRLGSDAIRRPVARARQPHPRAGCQAVAVCVESRLGENEVAAI